MMTQIPFQKQFMLAFFGLVLSSPVSAKYIRVFNSDGIGGGKVHHTSLLRSLIPCPENLLSLKVRFFLSQMVTDRFTVMSGSKVDKNVFLGNNVLIHPGVRVGSNSFIGDGSQIGEYVMMKTMVTLGSNVTIEEGVDLDEHVHVGDFSVVGINSHLYPYVFVGKRVSVGFSNQLYSRVIICDESRLGSYTTVKKHGLVFARVTIQGMATLGEHVSVGEESSLGCRIDIGNFSRVGSMVTLKENVMIGDHVLVGSGASIGQRARIKSDVTLSEKSFVAAFEKVCRGSVVDAEQQDAETLSSRKNLRVRRIEACQMPSDWESYTSSVSTTTQSSFQNLPKSVSEVEL